MFLVVLVIFVDVPTQVTYLNIKILRNNENYWQDITSI